MGNIRKYKLTILLMLWALNLSAQLDVFIGPSYGVAQTITNIQSIQQSYTSYLSFLDETAPSVTYNADDNFSSRALQDYLSFQLGFSFERGYAGVVFAPNRFSQTRTVIYDNNYGRSFTLSEHRKDIVFDFGYGSKRLDVFASFGVNFNKYRLVTYMLYPDGSKSLTNEYFFNGIYKHEDAGLSYGLGCKFKPFRYFAIELRYLYSHHSFPGENKSLVADITSLSDCSWAKTVGTESFPSNFQEPFSTENFINPLFSRHAIALTTIFYIRSNTEK